MRQMILLGDEAIAQAAVDAGISAAYGYPGTPSTEIFEYIEKQAGKDPSLHASWAANEKVAYEQAMGASFAGRRSIAIMKHVGLNVAADPFMNSAITGTLGGLVLAVADDPGMHSSQNEQDSRYFADFAQIHCYEPSNQQECYDMTIEAFNTSERFEEPVMIKLVTRIAHSRSGVTVSSRCDRNPLKPSSDRVRWTLLPTNARPQYRKLVQKQPSLREFAEQNPFNEIFLNPDNQDLGVITAGAAYNYFREVAGPVPPSFLKIGLYPMPIKKVIGLLDHVKFALIIEEGYPFIEKNLIGLLGMEKNRRFKGRFTGDMPLWGELTPDIVAKALGNSADIPQRPLSQYIKPRPPQLCPGCPHRDTFNAVNKVKEDYERPVVFSDIGCYTLGFYEPFETIESCLDMGASIGMAKGAADAGMFPVMCVIGDSTFGHSGIASLLTAANSNTNMVVIIVDNSTVAMTGTQESLSTGDRLVEITAGVGVPREHIRVLNPMPKNLDENARVLKEEVEYKGLSVIISQRPCVQLR